MVGLKAGSNAVGSRAIKEHYQAVFQGDRILREEFECSNVRKLVQTRRHPTDEFLLKILDHVMSIHVLLRLPIDRFTCP